ncbi:LysR family substrate-binding domain-containing protein [Streptomyces ferrugineus]|uniref:LysR family substrate-binding domain-containing protein n=1 Tax=Streptomyces ferrugineus TaxID=1413221 RepID=A0A7M2SW06_9ACTN|nr:LysR family substrate-binding domain-containing protein [Streptomyces ferrugineus]QOV40079.1 LysR family substrate-binding domain-containing protein [Streptomyces ferrugineus]
MTGSEASPSSPQAAPSFRLAYVPGVTPSKWVRIWNERFPDIPLTLHSVTAAQAPELLREGGADAGFVRLPVDRTFFSAIPLYTETTVVVVPKDHVIAAVEEVTAEDLADEVVFHPLDDVLGWERPPGEPAFERPATTADAVELVAAGVGLLVVPQSLARLHHRKDLTYRTLVDAPQSSIALSWPEEATTDLVEDFIGVVRGRTVNSTRGRTTSQPPATTDQPKRKRPDTGAGARRQPGTGTGTGGGRRGGAKGAKGAKGARRGKPRRRS